MLYIICDHQFHYNCDILRQVTAVMKSMFTIIFIIYSDGRQKDVCFYIKIYNKLSQNDEVLIQKIDVYNLYMKNIKNYSIFNMTTVTHDMVDLVMNATVLKLFY